MCGVFYVRRNATRNVFVVRILREPFFEIAWKKEEVNRWEKNIVRKFKAGLNTTDRALFGLMYIYQVVRPQ